MNVGAYTDMRTPYEQQEFQRKNPHLFTTQTQSVQPDGSIVAYVEVTKALNSQRERLIEIARTIAAQDKFNPDYWYLLDKLAETKQAVDYIETQMKICLEGFTENYKRVREQGACLPVAGVGESRV